ncbi:acetyltransferase (GNAT) family protein [Oxobacter pfennigii]|uniref:Acetyltransferase (GNAT) family protein n=1 Tax=Oxobacter pfennigii TaxID=36849 RepID=A0A0P8WBU0_9CLOT|nr:GNAT family protein [Oxobacter pfennigii]KPU46127.1 acetyltransferase (GNAT) family protein [Oxobacter pfennigii]
MIKLNIMGEEDFINIVKWNENKSYDYLLQWAGPTYNYPLTLEQVENYFLNEVKKPDANIFLYKIQHEHTNKIIGTVELREIDKGNKTGRVCRFLIGEENNRGKGIGRKALKEVLKIGFEDMGFEKITLGVFDFNEPAVRCYKSVGFTEEKFMEKARESSTGYWNMYEMAITKEKWQMINNN